MNATNRPDPGHSAAPDSGARRGFLGVAAAAVGGTMLASGARLFDVQAATPGTGSAGADAKVRWGLLIDSDKCASGCTDCVTACHTENGLPTPTRPTDVQ